MRASINDLLARLTRDCEPGEQHLADDYVDERFRRNQQAAFTELTEDSYRLGNLMIVLAHLREDFWWPDVEIMAIAAFHYLDDVGKEWALRVLENHGRMSLLPLGVYDTLSENDKIYVDQVKLEEQLEEQLEKKHE